MQQDSPNSVHKTYRKALIVIVAIFVLALTAAAKVYVLKRVTATGDNVAADTSKAISASDVIKNLNDTTDISALSSELYQKQTNNSSSISHKLNDKPYSVTVQTKLSTLFFAISTTQANDNTAVQSQIAAFMDRYGLKKTVSPNNSRSEMSYATFAGDVAVCQLEDSSPPVSAGMLRSHKVSCVDNTTIENEYAAIDNLLSIYQKSQTLSTFTKALRITKTEKNVAYSTIHLSSDKTISILLFAAVDDKWEYLADLSAGDAKYSTGAYIITPDTKALIGNPKYNGLIERDIR